MARRLDLWLPSYVLGAAARRRAKRERADKLTHVFFLVCDHYEPRHKATREGCCAVAGLRLGHHCNGAKKMARNPVSKRSTSH